MKHGRRIPHLYELEKLPQSIEAKLRRDEIILLVLYTGPMVLSLSFCTLVCVCMRYFPLLWSQYPKSCSPHPPLPSPFPHPISVLSP